MLRWITLVLIEGMLISDLLYVRTFLKFHCLPYWEVFLIQASRPRHQNEWLLTWEYLLHANVFFLICEVIQGELQRQTCLLRKGHACQHKETVFPGFPHIIWVLLVAYDLPILMSNIASKIEWISFLKFSIGNCSMAPRVNLKKAYDTIRLWLIAYAYVRHSRTYNENKLSISTPLFGLLPNFIPWGTRYKSVNYGIGNYWST